MEDNELLDVGSALMGDPQTLPVMPEVARNIIDSVTDELIDLPEVAQIISQDPAISARIIGLFPRSV